MTTPLRPILGACLLALVMGCASTGGSAPIKPAKPDVAALVEIERQAMQAYEARRNEEAIRLYTTLLESVPDEADYWYRLANSLVRTARYGEAEIAYQHLLGSDPRHPRAWHNLGIVRLRRAQEAFAGAVRHSNAEEAVFQESLELSTALFSLVGREPEGQKSTTRRDEPTWWQLIGTLGERMPITLRDVESAFDLKASGDPGSPYRTEWEGSGFPLSDGTEVSRAHLSVLDSETQSRLTRFSVHFSGRCIALEELRAQYPELKLKGPSSPHAAEYFDIWTTAEPWGTLNFATREIAGDDCLDRVTLASAEPQR